jgi:hypothetical protein
MLKITLVSYTGLDLYLVLADLEEVLTEGKIIVINVLPQIDHSIY